jgi:ABC-2 type transport system ATP-binding protein
MEEAEYCHRLALLYGGRVIALGSPRELKGSLGETSQAGGAREPTMEDVFVARIEEEERRSA